MSNQKYQSENFYRLIEDFEGNDQAINDNLSVYTSNTNNTYVVPQMSGYSEENVICKKYM